ncbi:hypothetical protein Mapa_013100 [Marchantia paleacea]|nr:hypothetical protein Mapa_013100 [Marchantia paleacea]
MTVTTMTVMNRVTVSKISKFRSISIPNTQPTRTQNGMTNMEIWVDDPMPTPKEMSSLSFIANTTALPCSAALPTRGRMITLMKATGMLHISAAPWIASTRYSERMEMKNVRIPSQRIELQKLSTDSSGSQISSASPSSVSYNLLWLLSWK